MTLPRFAARAVWLAIVVFVAPAGSLRADDPPKTGQYTETFTDRSPHSPLDKLTARLRINPQNLKDYDLKDESFSIYVPKDYKPDAGFGLLIFLHQGDVGDPFPGWQGVLDKHKLIWISANKASPNAGALKGIGMALDAAENMPKRYKVDPSRIYASGIAGALATSIAAVSYPEVFTGGGLYMFGTRFYKQTKGPGDDGMVVNPEMAAPDAKLLQTAKTQRSYVFVTGAASTDLGPRDKAVFAGYKDDGFTSIDLIEIPGAGNIVPPADWFDQSLAKLEDLRSKVTGSNGPAVANPNPPRDPKNPNMQPVIPPAPPAAVIQRGSFVATFDRRAKESEMRALTRAMSLTGKPDDYDVTKEKFHVYVPRHYEHGLPFGLIVSLSSSVPNEDGQLLPIWKSAVDKRNLIWVGAAGVLPNVPKHKRIGLALDAVENLRTRYTLDDDRIYTFGFADGTTSATEAALHFPQVFNGGVFAQGAVYFRDIVEGNIKYLGGISQPGAAALREAKQRGRYVFICGASSPLSAQVNIVLKQGFGGDRFGFAEFIDVKDIGNGPPGDASMGRAFEAIDKPLNGSDRLMMSNAARAERSRHFDEAWLSYGKASLRTTDEKRRAEADAKIEGLRKTRDEHLAGARKSLAAGDKAGAKLTLERLVKEYGALAGDEADKMLESLVGTRVAAGTKQPNLSNPPATTPTGPIPGGDQERIARARLENARKLVAKDLVAGYRELRELAEKYEATPSGKEAGEEAEKIWTDADKRKQIETLSAEAEANKLHALAKRYLDAADFKNARDKLEQLVENYPQSKLAAEAMALLEAIKDK